MLTVCCSTPFVVTAAGCVGASDLNCGTCDGSVTVTPDGACVGIVPVCWYSSIPVCEKAGYEGWIWFCTMCCKDKNTKILLDDVI